MLKPGFKRVELQHRYDVNIIEEDEWHSYAGEMTSKYLELCLAKPTCGSSFLLNAGSGVYQLGLASWREIVLDLFSSPLNGFQRAVCGDIEHLPFRPDTFDAVICVGEVLGYCDPSRAIKEFGRVMSPEGHLICDFANSFGVSHWLTSASGRAADLVVDQYNGAPEPIWVYSPAYVETLLEYEGFDIRKRLGTHTWSAAAKRIGFSAKASLGIERRLKCFPFPARWANVMTIVAQKVAGAT